VSFAVSDEPPRDEAPEPATPKESGIDLAHASLAAARAAAQRRGAGRRTGSKANRDAVTRRSGARPDDRDPQPLGTTISRLLADRGWETPAAIGGAMGRWDEIVGAEVAAHCRPQGYDDGVLTVAADSTAWATQMRLLAPQLVKLLNGELGNGTVTKVLVQGPSAPTWRKGGLSVRGKGPRDTYG
jgi:predicted nucleic acid-binding Zn ribbon protein